jgi:hypothetical protein
VSSVGGDVAVPTGSAQGLDLDRFHARGNLELFRLAHELEFLLARQGAWVGTIAPAQLDLASIADIDIAVVEAQLAFDLAVDTSAIVERTIALLTLLQDLVAADGVAVAVAISVPIPVPVAISVSIPVSIAISVSVSVSIPVSVTIAIPIAIPIAVTIPVSGLGRGVAVSRRRLVETATQDDQERHEQERSSFHGPTLRDPTRTCPARGRS